MSRYTPKLKIPGYTRLQNLRQEYMEVYPSQRNIVESVRNLKKGIQSEKANVAILLDREPYHVVGIAFQNPHDHFIRLGSLLQVLSHLESSDEYKEALAIVEPLEIAIADANEAEQLLQEKANQAAQELREAQEAALERAKTDPEFLKAQDKLKKIEAQKV